MTLKQSDQKKIINYINDNFNEDDISLSDYLCKNSSIIITHLNLPYEKDYFYYSIADVNSLEYVQFIKLMKKEIDKKALTSNIKIIEKYSEVLLSKSAYGKNVDLGVKNDLISYINNLIKFSNAPLLYENICAEFLKDFGFTNVKVTKSTSDYGIDIIAEFHIQNQNIIAPQKLNIIAQVKYFNTQIDSSYLRKIIGDSLFIRFDNTIYENISHEPLSLYIFGHSGFTKDAKSFAEVNGIKLIDTKMLCEHIASLHEPESSFCFKYLLKIYKNAN